MLEAEGDPLEEHALLLVGVLVRLRHIASVAVYELRNGGDEAGTVGG